MRYLSSFALVALVTGMPDLVLAQEFDMSVVPDGLVAQDQAPSGNFLTATEVRPILTATKGSWVAVREYDGQDLVYVTHLWAWRCGLSALALSVNDAPLADWTLPACHLDSAAPAAILQSDGLPYMRFPLGSVSSVKVQVVYDDLGMDSATYARASVLMP